MHIAVLLCTYNGAAHLPAQLQSLNAQTHADMRIYAFDDGSSDASLDLLQAHRRDFGATRISIRRGPGLGPAANFLTAVNNPHVQADAYAYCDQDDLWYPEKLARAVKILSAAPTEHPVLYCARTRLIDAEGNAMGLSAPCPRPPSFANALVQCIGGGNTMVFNDAARRLLPLTGTVTDMLNYDWWTYLAVTACGGTVVYDPEPVLDYRQHANNFMGRNVGLSAAIKRARMIKAGALRDWNNRNAVALAHLHMSHDNQTRLHRFTLARTARSSLARVAHLQRSGVYRQSATGQAALFVAAAWGRL